MSKHYQLIVLGSGPAGCTAAIYAARANMELAIITGVEQGGRITETLNIENWPGEEKGMSGSLLMEKMINQAKKFGAKIVTDNVYQVELSNRPFLLKGYGDEYGCDALIIATGASPKYLGIPSEKKYIGRGLSSCAVCDGYFYKNKKVVVIGGGNSAVEDSLYMAKLSSEVTLISRRDKLRADEILVEQLKKFPNIKQEVNYVVDEILGDDNGVTGLKIKGVFSGLKKELQADCIFVATGYKPNTDMFVGQLEMNNGYIKTGYEYTTSTNLSGIFAAGDVISPLYNQAIVAAGSGCMAALDVKAFLNHISTSS